tara:strand:- start:4518 stop:4763 length:246 start_codon:yes stop_codon:yes gene_type:complete
MIANIIYFVVAAILIFVLILAVKAITRGVEAKSELRAEKESEEMPIIKNNISDELAKIDQLYKDGIISEEEFKKAKDKVLK